MKDKWITIFRQNMRKAGLDEANYSDKEILKFSKGTYAPVLTKESNIEKDWVYDLYWQALLTMDPNEVIDKNNGFVDMNIFKQRVKNNQN